MVEKYPSRKSPLLMGIGLGALILLLFFAAYSFQKSYAPAEKAGVTVNLIYEEQTVGNCTTMTIRIPEERSWEEMNMEVMKALDEFENKRHPELKVDSAVPIEGQYASNHYHTQRILVVHHPKK